jgi:hypothetical protein
VAEVRRLPSVPSGRRWVSTAGYTTANSFRIHSNLLLITLSSDAIEVLKAFLNDE